MEKQAGIKIVCTNKKAHFNYFLSDFLECGIVLTGTEIKSVRNNSCSLSDAYIIFKNHEAEIINMHINPYDKGNIFNHDPLRNRKLLLHKKQISFFENAIKKVGFTVVPTKVYFKKGLCKLEIALAKGKKLYDKRETIKKRDLQREMKKGND